MVRLFANMMAGHAIALALTCIIFIMATMGIVLSTSMTVVSVAMSIFMMLLELLVSFSSGPGIHDVKCRLHLFGTCP